jgi:outer membrane protein assembly factor BamD
MKNKAIILIISILIILFVGCSKKPTIKKPANVWMQEGLTYFDNEDYKEAALAFENAVMEAETPELAAKAQLFLGDSYFFREKYNEAIPSYEEYLRIYSDSKDAKFAMYRLGLCYYNQVESIDRDQTNTKKALQIFMQLKSKYPEFAKEVSLDEKIKELREYLAEKDIYIAKFYFRIGKDKAAELRLKHFMENYTDTSYFPKATLMLVEYLLENGRRDEAVQYVGEFVDKCNNPRMFHKVERLLKKYSKK